MAGNPPLQSDTTIAELLALIDRTKKSLCEAGKPELAEHCHVTLLASGEARLTFTPVEPAGSNHSVVAKALSIDPEFEYAGGDQ